MDAVVFISYNQPMQAVILAAGRGTRMGNLTEDRPKALLSLGEKTILEREFDALPESIEEVIIVVGYLGGLIRDKIGGIYQGKTVLYVEQEKLDGTAGALWRAKDILHDSFIVMMADDLYAKEDLERCMKEKDWSVLLQRRSEIRSKGKVELDEEGNVVDVAEGNHGNVPGLLNTNLFKLDTRVFQSPLVPRFAGSDEFGLPQTVIAGSKLFNIPLRPVETDKWVEITTPEDVKKAEQILADTRATKADTKGSPL